MKFQNVNHFLRVIDESEWIHCSGKPEAGEKVRVLTSVKEAQAVVKDDYLRYYLMEQANLIRDDVSGRSIDAYRLWNDFVIDVQPDVEDVVARHLSSKASGVTFEKVIFDRVNWIVLHASIEVYYCRYTDRRFYRTLVDWLLRGHISLGWDGNFPDGVAIVF